MEFCPRRKKINGNDMEILSVMTIEFVNGLKSQDRTSTCT